MILLISLITRFVLISGCLADYTVEEIGGKTYLFVGGALSIDRELRLEGHSWWSDEDIKELSDDEWNSIAGKFDVVITHTAPSIAPPVLRESSMAVKMASFTRSIVG